MTWDELEKRLQYYLYEQKNQIRGHFESGNKRLSLHSLLYLCKKCYETGLEYGKRNLDTL